MSEPTRRISAHGCRRVRRTRPAFQGRFRPDGATRRRRTAAPFRLGRSLTRVSLRRETESWRGRCVTAGHGLANRARPHRRPRARRHHSARACARHRRECHAGRALAEHMTLIDDFHRPREQGPVVSLAHTICRRAGALPTRSCATGAPFETPRPPPPPTTRTTTTCPSDLDPRLASVRTRARTTTPRTDSESVSATAPRDALRLATTRPRFASSGGSRSGRFRAPTLAQRWGHPNDERWISEKGPLKPRPPDHPLPDAPAALPRRLRLALLQHRSAPPGDRPADPGPV